MKRFTKLLSVMVVAVMAITAISLGSSTPSHALPSQCAVSWSNLPWPSTQSQCFAGTGQHRAVGKFKSWLSGQTYTLYGPWVGVGRTSSVSSYAIVDKVVSASYQRR